MQRRALRACADVVDSNPNFVNHAEVFHQFDLPHDSFELRQLAEREAPGSCNLEREEGEREEGSDEDGDGEVGSEEAGAKKATKKAAKKSETKGRAKKAPM